MENKVKHKLILDKIQKSLFVTIPLSLVVIAALTIFVFVLSRNNLASTVLIVTFVLIDIVLILLFFYQVAYFYYKFRSNRTLLTENEYNLHRFNLFYNFETFARKINLTTRFMRRRKAYVIAFKPAKTSLNSSTITEVESEVNGYVADYLIEKFDKDKNLTNKHDAYCYSRGIFYIFLCDNNVDVNKIIIEIEEKIYQIEQEHDFRIFIQPNFGVAEYNPAEEKEFSIFELTNRAMEARENAERNFETVLYFSHSMRTKNDADDIKAISNAINNGEFVVYYQPKYNLTAHKFTSSEALIRWNSPTRGLLSPYKFISTAEHAGLIHRLDMFVLEQVCKDLAETRRKGRRLVPVSINFSIYEFFGNNFVNNVIGVIEKHKINPSLIEIEVTESTTGVNQFLTISILKKLREYGLRILMDDFGIGYSNFNNLRTMPIDVLKIDKSFVDNIVTDVKSREIARFITSLGLQIGLEVIAEGVDNAKQVEILKKFKCSTIQGFYFSKPLPKVEYEKFLANNEFEKGAR